MSRLKIHFKGRFWESCGKLILLLIFIFLPLTVNILLALIPATNKFKAISDKIIPGEMLAYSLGLIAPLFLMLLKTHGKNFKVPALKPMFIIAFIVYFLSLILSVIAKNGLIHGIDFKPGHRDFYFWLSLVFLFVAILLRLYTDYHESRFTDYKQNIDNQQTQFNVEFINSINNESKQ